MKNIRLLGVLAVAGSTMLLSACGFALRGTPKNTIALDSVYADTQIIAEEGVLNEQIKQKLATRLALLGVGNAADSQNQIRIKNLRQRRYELVGVLTEVRLVLTADVQYQMTQNGKPTTINRSVQVERSYQFNEAGVATSDQQGEQAQAWLQEHLAERIAEQYYALGLAN